MSEVVAVVGVRNTTDAVEVDFDDGVVARFHPIWLRDSCRCALCRHPVTLRRVDESMRFPIGMIPEVVAVAADGSGLRIEWPDGHVSTAAAPWLRSNATTGPTTGGATDRLRGRTPWGSEITERLPWMEYSEVIADRAAMLHWLETIDRTGLALLRGMPTDRAGLTDLADRIGPIRASNYGVEWEIEATVAPKNAVYSARGLSPHTDLPYRQHPPGLQLLLCDVADPPGGESLLADGYRVAEALLAEDPECWAMLTRTAVSFTYVDDDSDLCHTAPMIGLRADQSYGVFRHAPGLLTPFDPDPDSFEPLYSAVHRFTRMLADPAFEVRIRLEPGELLAFDNHRVLHGRAPFDLSPGGRRHLLGCYLDIDDLHSRISVLSRSPH